MDIEVIRNYMLEFGKHYIRQNDFNEIEVDTCLFLKANMSDTEVKNFIYSALGCIIEDKKYNEAGEVTFKFTNVILKNFLLSIEDYELTECSGCDVCGRIFYKNSIINFWCDAFDGNLCLSYEGEKLEEEE